MAHMLPTRSDLPDVLSARHGIEDYFGEEQNVELATPLVTRENTM